MSLSVHGPAGDRTPAAFAAGYGWAPFRMEVQERKHTLNSGTFWSRQWGPPQNLSIPQSHPWMRPEHIESGIRITRADLDEYVYAFNGISLRQRKVMDNDVQFRSGIEAFEVAVLAPQIFIIRFK